MPEQLLEKGADFASKKGRLLPKKVLKKGKNMMSRVKGAMPEQLLEKGADFASKKGKKLKKLLKMAMPEQLLEKGADFASKKGKNLKKLWKMALPWGSSLADAQPSDKAEHGGPEKGVV